MTSHSKVLGAQSFFTGLPGPSLEAIASCSRDAHFEADEWILREGDPASVFYVLTTGRAALEINAAGLHGMTIETLGPGDVVGISWILPGQSWTFDARAVDVCTALAIDAARLRKLCDNDTELGYELYKRFAGLMRSRLQATRVQLLDLYGRER